MEPVTVGTKVFTTLDEVVAALQSGEIKLSQLPKRSAEKPKKPAKKKKEAPTLNPDLNELSFRPDNYLDIQVFATLVHNKEAIRFSYNMNPGYPYGEVPASIFDEPFDRQRQIVEEAIRKSYSVWQREQSQRAQAFSAFVHDRL